MSNSKELATRFYLEFIDSSKDSYYVTKWGQAKPAEIISETSDKAAEQLISILPRLPTQREWKVRVVKIVQEPPQ